MVCVIRASCVLAKKNPLPHCGHDAAGGGGTFRLGNLMSIMARDALDGHEFSTASRSGPEIFMIFFHFWFALGVCFAYRYVRR